MADSEITAVVDKEKSARNIDSNAETRTGSSLTTDVPGPSRENWPTMKELVDPKGPFIPKWNVIFIISCVFAVLLDPLFLYIPIINEDMKCLRLDNNLKMAALLLRSVTDICYLLNIFLQVYSYKNCSAVRSGSCSNNIAKEPSSKNPERSSNNIAKKPSIAKAHSYILIDILAVLPLPQVVILNFLCKMKGSGSFSTRKLMNFLVLVQYVPRVFRIYLSCHFLDSSFKEETPIWLKGLLNFFLYILASHVFGAFWYFFAVQRVTTCWQYGCRIENGCDPNNLDCHDHHALRNIAFLNDACSIHPPNEKFFDFGMYLNILQLGILGSTNYPEKLSNCFGWGLRNLSSLGSNLQPSTDTWENLFAASISIIGLLLFIYLIGNLQTYMQLEISRTENLRWKKNIHEKMEKKGEELEQWLSNNGIPLRKKSDILVKVKAELEEKRDVDIENILSILPLTLQKYMKSCMPLNRLNVALPPNVHEEALRAISRHLKPKKYNKTDIIIQEDKPLEMMIFIVDGSVIIEMEGWSDTLELGAGKFYGEKLLTWPAWTSSPGLSNESVRAITEVEVLVLTASDMKTVGSKFKSHFGKKITPRKEAGWELLTSDLVKCLRKVPMFQSMDSQVLKEISRHLKRFCYNNDAYIIRESEPLNKLFFLVEGSSLLIESTRPSKRETSLGIGELYGEELVHWVVNWSRTTFPANVLLSTSSVKVCPNSVIVDVRELTIHDLKNIVSKYMPQFMQQFAKQPYLPMDIPDKLSTFEPLITLLKQVPILQNMDEEVLKAICEEFKLMKYNDKSPDIITSGENKFDKMFLIVSGLVCIKKIACDDHFYCYSGQHYGERELFEWVSPSLSPLTNYTLPESRVTVEAVGDVEAQVLMADDLVTVASKFNWHFGKEMAQTDPDRKHLRKKPTRRHLELGLLDEVIVGFDDSEAHNVYDEKEVVEESSDSRKKLRLPRGKQKASDIRHLVDEPAGILYMDNKESSDSRKKLRLPKGKQKSSDIGHLLDEAAGILYMHNDDEQMEVDVELVEAEQSQVVSDTYRKNRFRLPKKGIRGKEKSSVLGHILQAAVDLDCDWANFDEEELILGSNSGVLHDLDSDSNDTSTRTYSKPMKGKAHRGRMKTTPLMQILNAAATIDLDRAVSRIDSGDNDEEPIDSYSGANDEEQLFETSNDVFG